MGTSAASKGPGAGVSFDPPWLDDDGGFTPDDTLDTSDDGEDENDVENPSIAPPARFREARINLGHFAQGNTGRADFNKAAGHYSRTGMGGAGRLVSRMRHSTATGAKLAQFLSSASASTDSTVKAWVKDIVDRGLNGQALIDAIIQQVAPSSGSRDEESCADSMARALSNFIENNEDADLLNLEAEQIREITEQFIANEACNRLVNDIGQIFESDKVSLKESLSLLNEMREYLRADLALQIQQLWEITENPTHSQLDNILKAAVQRTFEVYEGEL